MIASLIRYELVEEEGWRLSVEVLEEKLAAAKANGIHTRGLVVINPGNPTGNSLPLENMKEVLRFCGKHGLILMADEVYQENVWLESRPFHSFKKVLHTMADAPKVQLVSFHSTSKGFLGECGMRGGYFELCNFDPEVLPPNTALRPPAPHALFAQHSAYCPIGALRPSSPPHARSPTHTPPRRPHATHTPPTRHPGLRPKPRAGGPAAAQTRLNRAVLQHARPDRDRLDGPAARARGGIIRPVQR